MLIAGALVFNYVVTSENIPNSVSTVLAAYGSCRADGLPADGQRVLLLLAACSKAAPSCWSSCPC
jgi:hypothetical protein